MSQLRARPLDQGELDGAVELLDGAALKAVPADQARAALSRLGGVEEKALSLGDGWAASVELDGTTLLVRGEPDGASARWMIYAQPAVEGGVHAAKKLSELLQAEAVR